MIETHSVFTNLQTPATAAKPVSKVASDTSVEEAKPARRIIRDTVDISGSRNKMVNLARGQELAGEIRSKPVDENFAADLRKAMEDVIRITRLFKETIKAAFTTHS